MLNASRESPENDNDLVGAARARKPAASETVLPSDAIAKRAYELYEMRGRADGADLRDWLDAERELREGGRTRRATAERAEGPVLHRKKNEFTTERDVPTVATRDHDGIARWARRHQAEPATGEATASGPASVHVRDGGAGVRFNFPGAARFRPIAWDEWFANFDRHHLLFVHEDERSATGQRSAYYLLVSEAEWEGEVS